MAVNERSTGRMVTVSIPSGVAVTSGKEARVTSIIGIPQIHGIAGMSVPFAVEGVWGLTVSIGGTLGVGSYLYYIHSTNLLSVGAGNNDPRFGQIVKVLNANSKVFAVRLMITPPPAPLYA